MKQIYLLLTALALIGSAMAEDNGPFHFEFEEVAPGVWAGVRADPPRFPVMGNVTFVISDEGVVVFDGGVKKLPRVHQYFSIKAAQEHVRERRGGIYRLICG